MSKEIRVALLALVAFGLTYWGYNFIIGKNLFKESNYYLVEYENVGGLKISTPVRINGVQIGRVAKVENQMDKQNVVVRIDLNPEIKIPKETYAYILNETFMGQQAVELRYKTPCSAGALCAVSGDYILGDNLSVLASTVSQDELGVYLEEFKKTMVSLLDTLNQQVLSEDSDGPLANSIRDMEATMSNLKNATGQLNGLMYQSKDDITSSLNSVEKITANLEDNNEQIGSILANTDAFTEQLSEVDIKQMIEQLSASVSALNSTIEKADQTFAGINKVVKGLENGEGTLGMLLQDPELYNELSQLSAKTDSLMSDLQDRPYRYLPLKRRKQIQRYDAKDEKAGIGN